MSHVLHIWEKPASKAWPESAERAGELLSELQDLAEGQNEKFLTFAERLKAEYSSGEIEDDEQPPRWSEEKLDGLCDTAVYSIGIRADWIDEAVPVVIQVANGLGLNVTDDLSGDVALANGTLLKFRPQALASAPSVDIVPKEQVLERQVFERLAPLMERHGFQPQKNKTEFKCVFPNGWHKLKIVTSGRPAYCRLMVEVYSRFHAVNDLMWEIASSAPPSKEAKNAWTTLLGQHRWMDEAGGFISEDGDKEYRLYREADMEAATKHLMAKLEFRLFPILEQYKSIKGLDELLNTPSITDSLFFERFENGGACLIAAYLAQNPRTIELCDLFEAKNMNARNYLALVEQTRSCVAYIRKHWRSS